jgi:hypothetical protein
VDPDKGQLLLVQYFVNRNKYATDPQQICITAAIISTVHKGTKIADSMLLCEPSFWIIL